MGGLEGAGWEVGCLYSPVNGAAGPLTHCPGAAGLQISTHAHICREEYPDHLKGNFSALHSLHDAHFPKNRNSA